MLQFDSTYVHLPTTTVQEVVKFQFNLHGENHYINLTKYKIIVLLICI